MLSRLVRVQVTVFAVIALVGMSFVGARYAGLDSLYDGSGYTVTAELAESGGVFTHAEVTYRGVAVGRVGEMRMADDGIEVDLRIDGDAPPVPDDVEVVVANRSAVGEQYVDLRPRREGEPYLTDGSVIDEEDSTLPLSVDQVLLTIDDLVESLPGDDLRTVVDELYEATRGTAPSFQALLDALESFVDTATEHLPQTKELLADGNTVLGTQLDTSESIAAFGENARLIAEEIADADGDVRRVISSGPGAAGEISTMLSETDPDLGMLVANLTATSEVLVANLDGLDTMMVASPEVVGAGSDVFSGGVANFGLVTTFFDPLPCTEGYEGTTYREARDTSPAPLNTGAGCVR
ncbi:phospholipid/cholesterol/gamma-HCH transport system substrate-binding protein [Haloechinothrix alba]|uniref:Phospholipid/cholesterol/gamma-HCH transport system substrate-binding protein n=1 Tax=Haloechinothrix alba TaxID=664784 RepID=A0A238VFF3_9PSEU|nr:MlaD family protein [Haloechinothrix alba]SNR33115.1 phospholipid/cholesterol/gamma-HCH transport system substrate-binding protein [Haloechinothrix alba]